MAMSAASERESQALQDSLPPMLPLPQGEGSQVVEALAQAQIKQQQRRGTIA